MVHGPVPPVEVICKAGEIMFIPSGWWHSVMNLEDDTIAITQNFVSEHNLDYVLGFLKNRSCQISGVERADGLYERFLGVLQESKPEVLERTLQRMGEEKKRREEAQVVKKSVSSMCDLFSSSSAVPDATSVETESIQGFSFSF